MASKNNSRKKVKHEPNHQVSNDSDTKIAESLNIIAAALKDNELEKRVYEIEKNSLRTSLISAIVIAVLTMINVIISFQGNALVKKNMNPYFHLSSVEKAGKTTAYQITNDGGEIQSATITLRNYIDVFDRYYTRDHYYFPYAEVIKTFPGEAGECFLIDFADTHFGTDEWTKESGNTDFLRGRLDEEGLGTTISYLEVVEIQYVDADRNIMDEFYFVQEDENNEFALALMTVEHQEEIKTLIPDGCEFKFQKVDEFCRELGSTGSFGGGRGNDPQTQFCLNVVDKLKEEISRKTIVSFD